MFAQTRAHVRTSFKTPSSRRSVSHSSKKENIQDIDHVNQTTVFPDEEFSDPQEFEGFSPTLLHSTCVHVRSRSCSSPGVKTSHMAQMNGTSNSTRKVPEDEPMVEALDAAADQVEESHATWQESRRLMNDTAKARVF